jgi:TolB protein
MLVFRRSGDIWVMNGDGSGAANLTNTDWPEAEPAWSHDSHRIAYVSSKPDEYGIWTMNRDGGNQERLLDPSSVGAVLEGKIEWSPDGSRIAFGGNDIFVVDSDGTNHVRLTDHNATEEAPPWAPAGDKIAFASNMSGMFDVWVMNADGSEPRNLTNDGAEDWTAAWSPDGSKIAFSGMRNGDWDILVMNSDGSCATNITNDMASDVHPDWQPIPQSDDVSPPLICKTAVPTAVPTRLPPTGGTSRGQGSVMPLAVGAFLALFGIGALLLLARRRTT